MKWFAGSIPEAIAAAKSRNAIFVVYVHDSSEASKTTDETLGQEEVVAVLGSESFVAIQLENGTEGAKQFSQIYPLVLVPSLFFISGETGIPLEVLGGPLTPSTLTQKLEKLVPRKEGATSAATPTVQTPTAAAEPVPSSSQTQQLQGAEAGADACAEASTCDEENPGGAGVGASVANDVEGKEQVPDVSKESDDSENANPADLSLEEKVERAKALLAEKQAKDAREKAEEGRQKEIDRRKMGQEIAKQRQQQEEENIKQAVLERKRDKEEDRLARERVRAQIATDRAEREARAALLRGEQPPPGPDVAASARPAPQPTPTPSTSNTSRLKFRLPNGSSSLAQFPATTTLDEVRQYIQDNIALPFSTFTLASTVHQGSFRAEDNAMSLRDLGLVPSAILAILPASGGSGVGRSLTSGGGGGFWDILWLLLTPITFLLGMLRRFMGGGGGENRPVRSNANGPAEPKPKQEEGSATTRNRPQTAYGNRGEARLRREGNIYRFSNPDDDDDDENNTWNGNSTQQM